MVREVEIFAINASNSNCGVFNRWVACRMADNYEVYLETTKDNKASKAHAATFNNKDEALEFIVKMDKLCTNGRLKTLPSKKVLGFTLVELLVVVAIIGILMVIVVPMYKQNVMKTQVGTMWHEAEAAKLAVTSDFYKTYVLTNSNYGTSITNRTDFTTTNNVNISSITVVNGIITVTGNSNQFSSQTIWIAWTPTVVTNGVNSDLVWHCSFSTATAAYVSSDYCK